MLLVAVCAFFACEPIHEDIKNAGHIAVQELKAMTSISLDIDQATGKTGNVLTCNTGAPVNARWTVDGKEIKIGSYAWKKLKLGEHKIVLEGLCADGSLIKYDTTITCDVITNPLERYYIYGVADKNNPNHHMIGVEGAPFIPGGWDAAAMRFSANEGKFTDVNGKQNSLPYLTDAIYWDFKTLIFDITDATPDCAGRIMNGWWSARYDGDKDVKFTNGQWELQLTEAIAKDCAQGNGGGGRDLDIMVTSGSCKINAIYYEE